MNIATEEYDQFIEENNEKILGLINPKENSIRNYLIGNSNDDTEDFLYKYNLDNLRKGLEYKTNEYTKSINDLKKEYDLIVQHRKSLEEKLFLLEIDKY